jgi:hypothetical protein
MKTFLSLLALAVLSAAGARADSVPIVGLDRDHQPRSQAMSDAEFTKLYASLIQGVAPGTLASLEAREKTAAAATYWLLRDVAVGLGLNFSVGLGPIWSVSAAPRVRLGFSNSTHPKIPD